MLTYMEIHLYFTLPVVGLLLWILKPFHSSQDTFKYKFLLTIAFVTASVWDNYIVYHKAWSYCPTCVVIVIGFVPLEEYMFFIIMTVMTVSFANLMMRWHLASIFIKPNTPWIQSFFIRFVPILGLLTIAYKAWRLTVPGKPLFYGSCILWYACPVLALLWYGSGEYILRRSFSVLISIAIPTLYLCWVDILAIREGVWHISVRTSTSYFVVPHLPLEEFLFFTLINTVLVFATCTLDRVFIILQLYRRKVTMMNLVWAFALPDQVLDHQLFHDLDQTQSILKRASQSFYAASAAFPAPIRQDLIVLYGFCRATDDLCDDEQVPIERRLHQLEVTRRFVQQVFSQKPTWLYIAALPASCQPAFRAFATHLAGILKEETVLELLDGYQWDLGRQVIRDEADLQYYSTCVASSVGEMCTRVILHHEHAKQSGWLLDHARQMGLVLQYVNMARDIVTDSTQLGRCYLPQDWLTSDEIDQIAQGQARRLGEDRLKDLSMRLLSKADQLMKQAQRGLDGLPASSQGGVRAACNVYASIGTVLRQSKIYPTRAHLSSRQRVITVFKSIYL
ncbi:hypothetical protein G6F57_005127 [Rhizopus arrhizus]|nr:hypothetical protein G6F30_006308 [Rhizopus arrhizus]KAG1424109.1 hypothetical protein G6F58_002537 [Rhizopus delemar]KAG0981892.1 hypothetical protein G6F29_006725 [Rhizopus arrhizus]KAG0994210.1 hypothetical protein G6F28_005963 [Rhizopus arrhizus]KAG1008183.1 hypothetical protein G6F27_006732 [Rhizopus arrhizus]